MNGTKSETCKMTGCTNPAEGRPVFDANPVASARKQIGTVAICPACQAGTDRLNGKLDRRTPGQISQAMFETITSPSRKIDTRTPADLAAARSER